ncbi:MAG: type II toxin-antitoxin system mRNA interferase toxin, RelE/StbE family [Oxalobacteraceae bacterium]|nr:MAG: type II toxin-antitoxin system mRNA interferase toxin, RelE/StbE family [Oxalobacteraceae bacterium]
MACRLEFAEGALKDLFRPERHVAWHILSVLAERLLDFDNERKFGKTLVDNFYNEGFRSYRIGKYRIIAKLEDNAWYVLTVKVAIR